MLKRSGWILLFLGFWAWRLAAEPQITFPKETQLTVQLQTEVVNTLVKSCAIAIDFADLNLVDEVRRPNPEFDLYLLTFNVQFRDSQQQDQIRMRVRDYKNAQGRIEVLDVHSKSKQCFYRGLFLTSWFNDYAYEYEPWMQGLQSIKKHFDANEMEVKMRFTAYDSKNFLRTEKRIAELVWRDIFAVSGVEPFPCGVVFKGDYKASTSEEGYLLEARGESAVDTCYNEEIAKTWRYSVLVKLYEDGKSGEMVLKSSRKPEQVEQKNLNQIRP